MFTYFTKSFASVGLLFAVLSALLFVIAYLRARHSTHDFADRHKDWLAIDKCIKTKGQESGRIFGRPFITAGWPVVEVALVVALAEIALLGLIINHPISVGFWNFHFLFCADRSLDMKGNSTFSSPPSPEEG